MRKFLHIPVVVILLIVAGCATTDDLRRVRGDLENQIRLANTVETRVLEGWGYAYYEVTGPAKTMSTLMAPPDGAPIVKNFVTAAPLDIRYNSRLPIVVYVPQGFEVRYRIWTASETTWKADKG